MILTSWNFCPIDLIFNQSISENCHDLKSFLGVLVACQLLFSISTQTSLLAAKILAIFNARFETDPRRMSFRDAIVSSQEKHVIVFATRTSHRHHRFNPCEPRVSRVSSFNDSGDQRGPSSFPLHLLHVSRVMYFVYFATRSIPIQSIQKSSFSFREIPHTRKNPPPSPTRHLQITGRRCYAIFATIARISSSHRY